MSRKGYAAGDRNVFKDVGAPNADEHLVKAQLVFKIDAILKKRHMKQTEAATLLGIRQPDVSKMLRGEFGQFSVERLLRFLVKRDQDVEIVVRPTATGATLRRCRCPKRTFRDASGQGASSVRSLNVAGSLLFDRLPRVQRRWWPPIGTGSKDGMKQEG